MIILGLDGKIGYGSFYNGMAPSIRNELSKDDFKTARIKTRVSYSDKKEDEIVRNMEYAVHKNNGTVSYITLNETVCENSFDYHLITIGKEDNHALEQHRKIEKMLKGFDFIGEDRPNNRTKSILEQMIKETEI